MITLNFRVDFRGGFFFNRMDFRVMLTFDNELESGFSFPTLQEHKNFETLPTALSPITFFCVRGFLPRILAVDFAVDLSVDFSVDFSVSF